jgi:hypothetical protein
MIKLMDLLNEYNINKPGKIEIPNGWKKLDVDPEPDEDGNQAIETYSAPMEGWDENHEDIVTIMKNPQGKYFLSVYIPFGDWLGDEEIYNSLYDAQKSAVEIMEELKEEWETDDEEELDEYKVNNPYKYPDATLVIYDDGETLLDADSGEYYSDPSDDDKVSYTLILNNDIGDFMSEDDAFEEYAPEVFKVIRDKANGKIEALDDYVMVTANIDDLKKIFNVQIV